MALLLKNVGKTFENTGQATLKNINLEIKPGEVPLCSWEKRMRQKHAAESDCRPGKTDRRKNSFKWKRSESTRFGTDSDVSGTRSVSMAECNSKYKVWNGDKRSSKEGAGLPRGKVFENDAA